MSIERVTTWKNRLGVDVFTIDGDDGIRDNINNGLVSLFRTIDVDLFGTGVSRFIHIVHNGVWVVNSVSEAHVVAGGAGAGVTVVVCPQASALGSGIPQLTAVIDLTLTAPARSFGSMITTPTEMTRGDVLALGFSGTITGLVGCLTVFLKRIR
jgi:hypothetical protein